MTERSDGMNVPLERRVMRNGRAYKLEIHGPHKPAGYYLHYPEGFDRKSVTPHACGWFQTRADAEAEALRLAEATGDAFMVVRLVSKCVPWHCFTPAHNTGDKPTCEASSA